MQVPLLGSLTLGQGEYYLVRIEWKGCEHRGVGRSGWYESHKVWRLHLLERSILAKLVVADCRS